MAEPENRAFPVLVIHVRPCDRLRARQAAVCRDQGREIREFVGIDRRRGLAEPVRHEADEQGSHHGGAFTPGESQFLGFLEAPELAERERMAFGKFAVAPRSRESELEPAIGFGPMLAAERIPAEQGRIGGIAALKRRLPECLEAGFGDFLVVGSGENATQPLPRKIELYRIEFAAAIRQGLTHGDELLDVGARQELDGFANRRQTFVPVLAVGQDRGVDLVGALQQAEARESLRDPPVEVDRRAREDLGMRVGVLEQPRPLLGFRERDETRGGFLMGHLGQEVGGGTPAGFLLFPGLDREAQLVHAAGAEQVPQGLLVIAAAGRIEVGGRFPRRMEVVQPLDLGFDAGTVLLARVITQGALVDLRRCAGGAAEHRRVVDGRIGGGRGSGRRRGSRKENHRTGDRSGGGARRRSGIGRRRWRRRGSGFVMARSIGGRRLGHQQFAGKGWRCRQQQKGCERQSHGRPRSSAASTARRCNAVE